MMVAATKTGDDGAIATQVLPAAPDRRSQLLEAAARVFAEKGFHQATVDEIAVEAQAAKGTVYNYFESKDGLFLALVEAKLEELARLYAEAAERSEPPLVRLRRLVVIHVEYLRRQAPLWRVLMAERPMGHAVAASAASAPDGPGPGDTENKARRKAFFRERIGPIIETVTAILQEARDAGEVQFDDLRLAARTMVGAVMMNAFHGDDTDGEQLAGKLADLYLYGVAGRQRDATSAVAETSGKTRQSENTPKKS